MVIPPEGEETEFARELPHGAAPPHYIAQRGVAATQAGRRRELPTGPLTPRRHFASSRRSSSTSAAGSSCKSQEVERIGIKPMTSSL